MVLERRVQPSYAVAKAGEAYHLRICDHILDNIYGQIGITEVEKQIERLAIFKRLHSVSQLGLVNWIFPCALHTRYTHSVGVMHVAGQMAEHINQNVWESLGGKNFFDDCDIQIIRLSGLLHDIGHYPMSHNVEQAYCDAYKEIDYEQSGVLEHLKHYVNCPDFLHPEPERIEKTTSGDKDFFEKYSGSKWPHHESAGQEIITHNKEIASAIKWSFVLLPSADGSKWVLNSKFSTGQDTYSDESVNQIVKDIVCMIGDIVVGNYGKSTFYPWHDKYSAMVQLIHSDLDADNLDYLLRDATFSGTSYGVMDMGILLNSLTVAKLQWSGDFLEEERYLVGIRKKGLGCVEQFLLNKFLAYTQMIFSKYASVLEAMLLRVMIGNASNGADMYGATRLQQLLSTEKTLPEYLQFSDHYIIEKLFAMGKDNTDRPFLMKSIISRLIHSCAFDLEKSGAGNTNYSECICASVNKEEIQRVMKGHRVYKQFLEVCAEISGFDGRELANKPDRDAELFSFRFEEYGLTKQVPLSVFVPQIEAYDATRIDRHYFRLATGIPVLEDNVVYRFEGEKELEKCQESLPPLSVDCSQSILHQIYDMKYISLRRYKIEGYKELSAS